MKNVNTLNCVIVDDEPMAIEGLQRQLRSLDFLNLSATFYNPIEASRYLESNPVDLVFLDVSMPQLSGLNLLQSLSSKPMVIFTTAHPNFALEAFRCDAIDYLMKPFSFEKLIKAINKALLLLKARRHSSHAEYTFIRSEGKYHRLYFDSINYIEGMKDYVKIHAANETLSVAMNLSCISEKLPQDQFIRIHKSYIVNKHKITKIDHFELIAGEVTLPVGNSYREDFQDNVLAEHITKK
jgi:DNA-binding LytR/AlgR family response regulator